MHFEFTEEQEDLRASVHAVLERECPMTLVREVVEKAMAGSPTDAPARLWDRMVELGWPALTIGEADGGLGLGFVELAVVLEELGRAVVPGPYLATVTQFAPAVREAGTDEQRRRFLGAVVEGGTGTLAVAEESGSWRPDAVATIARPDGDGWRLEGTKRHVVDGNVADQIVIAARVDGGDDIGLFVVPRDAVAVDPITALDASRPLATVVLADVHVPGDALLGDPANGRRALTRSLEEATVALALEMVGTCQSIFDVSLAYAKVREQFGVPIGSFQAMKHKFADMLVALEKARATAYFAALTIAEEDDRRALAVSMAKAAAGDCQRLLTQEGIQTLGGIGYTWEHDMHLYVKRAKSGEPLFGGTSDHRSRVADLIGLA
jgi:alkylation response protein AidB-like acyl-CoA dehydrogenase